MQTIKMGGCYKSKDGYSWLIIGVNKGSYFQVRDIEIDNEDYDEEIKDMTEAQIRECADLSICYRPYYHKIKGLYKVWDESKPRDKEIILQQ